MCDGRPKIGNTTNFIEKCTPACRKLVPLIGLLFKECTFGSVENSVDNVYRKCVYWEENLPELLVTSAVDGGQTFFPLPLQAPHILGPSVYGKLMGCDGVCLSAVLCARGTARKIM